MQLDCSYTNPVDYTGTVPVDTSTAFNFASSTCAYQNVDGYGYALGIIILVTTFIAMLLIKN